MTVKDLYQLCLYENAPIEIYDTAVDDVEDYEFRGAFSTAISKGFGDCILDSFDLVAGKLILYVEM